MLYANTFIASFRHFSQPFTLLRTAIRGSQHGRSIELHSYGAFAALTAPSMHRKISLLKSRFTWLAIRGETLFFGFPIFSFKVLK